MGADELPYRLRGIQGAPDQRICHRIPWSPRGHLLTRRARSRRQRSTWPQEAFGKLGLPGLVLASIAVDDHGQPWELARGWARLDPQEPLSTTRRFPVYTVSTLITATAVLRLAADGSLDLDRPANDHLRTIRLADGDITVRDLLTHTDGLGHLPESFAETVPDLVALAGPVLASSGTCAVPPRGASAGTPRSGH